MKAKLFFYMSFVWRECFRITRTPRKLRGVCFVFPRAVLWFVRNCGAHLVEFPEPNFTAPQMLCSKTSVYSATAVLNFAIRSFGPSSFLGSGTFRQCVSGLGHVRLTG